MRRTGFGLRLALLILVICGVAGMHTLGHSRHGRQSDSSDMGAHHAAAAMMAAAESAGLDSVGPSLGPVSANDHPAVPGDATIMCLAILAAGFALVVAVSLLRNRRVDLRQVVTRITASRARWRDPPIPTGVSINKVAVLRI